MISPHTPPGTLVVFRPISEVWSRSEAVKILRPNCVYCVDAMVEVTFGSGIGVFLVETAKFHRWRKYKSAKGKYRYSFPLEDFDLAVLPKCLADIRDAAPVEMIETVQG